MGRLFKGFVIGALWRLDILGFFLLLFEGLGGKVLYNYEMQENCNILCLLKAFRVTEKPKFSPSITF